MHQISGLIAKSATTDRFARDHGLARPAALAEGFGFLALDDENLVQVIGHDGGVALEGFEYLTPELMAVLGQSSRSGDLAYVETEYWGGTGSQGAVVFQAGRPVFGPKHAATGVINEALARLGVVSADPKVDAFDHVGLSLHRSNEAFRTGGARPSTRSGQRPARRRTAKPIWWILAMLVAAAAVWAGTIVAANVGIDLNLPVLH